MNKRTCQHTETTIKSNCGFCLHIVQCVNNVIIVGPWIGGLVSKNAQKSLESWSVKHFEQKCSFLKGKSHPAILKQAKCGIDWQGFQFQGPQRCQRYYLNCQLLTTDTFLPRTTDITLMFWPPFVAQTATLMGLSGLIAESDAAYFKKSHSGTEGLRLNISEPSHPPQGHSSRVPRLSRGHRHVSSDAKGRSRSFSSPTLTTSSTSGEVAGLVYGKAILLRQPCLQHVFTLQLLLLDLHQRADCWVRQARIFGRLSQPAFTPVIYRRIKFFILCAIITQHTEINWHLVCWSPCWRTNACKNFNICMRQI